MRREARPQLSIRGTPPRRHTALVCLAGGLSLAILGALVSREPVPRGDDAIYEAMAQHPFATHSFPFGYRFGLPWIVHVLPFNHTFSFQLLACLAAAGAAGYSFLLITSFDVEERLAGAMAVLMCVSPPFLIVAIRNGRNTDIVTVLFLMAGAYYLVRREHGKLAITLLLGAAFREAVLFLIPLAYAVWATRVVDRRALVRTALVAAPAVAAYLAIRLGVQTIGEAQVPGYGGSLVSERFTVIRDGLRSPFQEGRRMFTVFGPLWLLAPLALRDMRYARRGLVLVLMSLVAMTFALDWGRMILLAAPVFYPAAAHVLDAHRRWWLPTLLAGVALIGGYAIYMDRRGVRTGIIENPLPPYPVR